MAETSIARLMLAAARRDEQAFIALAALPAMNDAVIGFHAHQCVEKALKAVLAHCGVAFRRTHDVAELLDLLSDAGCALPAEANRLDELNPYAVEARYGLVEPGRARSRGGDSDGGRGHRLGRGPAFEAARVGKAGGKMSHAGTIR